MVGENQNLSRAGCLQRKGQFVPLLELLLAGHSQRLGSDLLQIAFPGDEDRHRVIGSCLRRFLYIDLVVINQTRTAVCAVFFADLVKFLHDDGLDAGIGFENLFQVLDRLFQFLCLGGLLKNIFLVDIAQFNLRHKFSLKLVDPETDHQVGNDLGIGFRAANNGDGLVNIQQDPRKALEQMEPFLFALELKKRPAANSLSPPCDPLLQQFPHAHDAGHTGNQNIEVAGKAVLQRRQAEKLQHELFGIDAALDVNGQLETGKVGLVTHIVDLLDLAGVDQLGYLVDDGLGGDGIRNLIDFNQIAVLHILPAGADLERATPRLIDGAHLGGIIDDLAPCGEVRRWQSLQQIAAGVADKCLRCLTNLPQIEAADIAGHSGGNSGVAGHQDVGKCGGKQDRLLHCAVIVVHHVHGVKVDVPEKLCRDGFQLGFGIT